MELYDRVARDISKLITTRYSTSFGLSSTLFDSQIRPHIYAIYGLVRIADEIVDTYRQAESRTLLDELENDCFRCIAIGYSVNPVVHAFGNTARHYGLSETAIKSFFSSMRMDIAPFENTTRNYERYIHGSAEAVGLLCLSVFVDGDRKRYDELSDGACALGAAYQKINFLRDLATDKRELGRWYFPNTTYETFDESARAMVIDDITNDIARARSALAHLPPGSKKAVALSLEYYDRLLEKIQTANVSELKKSRFRISNATKALLYIKIRILP